MVEVAAAFIRNGNKFLIFRRPLCKGNGGLWEFVGGKAEKGETVEQALIRECYEELSVTVKTGRKIADVTHEYPDITIHLTLIEAEITDGTPVLNEHIGMEWITADEIEKYDFCPADTVLLEEIRKII